MAASQKRDAPATRAVRSTGMRGLSSARCVFQNCHAAFCDQGERSSAANKSDVSCVRMSFV